jgi:predicted kinase
VTTLHVMMGLPGSGKSWIVDAMLMKDSYAIVCPDDYRKGLTGDINNQQHNGKVFRVAHADIVRHLSIHRDVIFDATNVKQEHRLVLAEIAKDMEAESHLHVVVTDPEICKDRMAARGRVVPTEAFERMKDSFDHAMLLENYRDTIDRPFRPKRVVETEPWDHITIHKTEVVR